MLDYQAIIKSDTATHLLNVFTFEYNNTVPKHSVFGDCIIFVPKSTYFLLTNQKKGIIILSY